MLGKDIKKFLDSNGISQAFICEKSGFSPAILSAMLNEKRKIEAQEYFIICDVLNVPLEKFKRGRGKKAS